MLDLVKVRGFVELDGAIKYSGPNIVTSAGFGLIASRLAGNTPNPPGWIAMGDSAAIPALTQTALQGTESQRVAGTVTVNSNAFTITANLGGLGADKTVGEFGIFNAASAGIMLARFTVPAFTLFAGNTISLSWTVYIGGL